MVAFGCAGLVIHDAREFAGVAVIGRTTTSGDVFVSYNLFRGLRFNYYSCQYSFVVDGVSYSGLADCPPLVADVEIRRKLLGFSQPLPGANLAVYYDAAHPSINSLLEFGGAGERSYRDAVSLIGIGLLSIFAGVLPAVFEWNENKGNGGVVVDARGTVIYPDEKVFDSKSVELPNGVAANGASPPGLRELYLEVVNEVHPDRAADEDDRALRERLMKEANLAFEHSDAGSLRRILEEYRSAWRAYSS